METTQAADREAEGRSAQVGEARGWGKGSKPPPSLPVPFDPHRRAACPDLKADLRALVAHLEAMERSLGLRQRTRKEQDRASFALAVEALACNLAGLAMLGLERPLAVPRSSGVMWSKSRYRSAVYGQHFLDMLDLMAHPEVALIADPTRGYKFRGGTGQRSTVRPGPALGQHLPLARLRWDAFTRAQDHEVLVLRGHKDPATGEAEALDYYDTAQTRRRRKAVLLINAHLRSAPLIIASGEAYLGSTKDGHPIDPTRRTVRRIFNNGSWMQGGRLYDGFWETMPREERFRLLRIETPEHPHGEPIANVDYGQLFTVLAYRTLNLEPPEADLYDIAGDGSHREGWKRLCNALLLSAGPLRNWPRGLSSAFPRGTKLREAVADVEAYHAPIARLFGTGLGFKLMLMESEMLIEALLRLFGQGVTALPLHDSVLVAGSQAGLAEETMAAAFALFTDGARARIKTTFAE